MRVAIVQCVRQAGEIIPPVTIDAVIFLFVTTDTAISLECGDLPMLMPPVPRMKIGEGQLRIVTEGAIRTGPTIVMAVHADRHPGHIHLGQSRGRGDRPVTEGAVYFVRQMNLVIEIDRPCRILKLQWFVGIAMAHATAGVILYVVTLAAVFHRGEILI